MSASRAPTVLTVVGGGTRAPSRSFPPGSPVSVFSVGAESDWVIVASGVERVHLYLAFDGREVHVAPAAPTARVFLDGRELGAGWHPARIGSELRFGGASLTVTNELARGGTQRLGPLNEPGEPAQSGRQLRTGRMGLTAAGTPTVLTVVGGGTSVPSRSFPAGSPVSVFSVGAESDWVIVAPGVERVHLYLVFDGCEVHVAPAAPTARVFLDGRELGAGWHPARIGSELRFGGASLTVTNELARGGTQRLSPLNEPGERAQPGGQLRTGRMGLTPPNAEGARPPMAGFAPVQPAPRVQGLWSPQAVQPAGGGASPDPGDPLRSTAQWHTPPGAMGPGGAPPANTPKKIQPAAIVPLGRADRTVASPPAPAQVTASPAVRVLAEPPRMPVLAPAEAPLPALADPAAATFGAREGDAAGTNTIADGGALRAHAARVADATPSVAFTSAQAYAEDVRRASGLTPVPAAGRQAVASNVPEPPEVSDAEAPRVAARFSRRSSWREASIAKKLTLVLLPFGLIGAALMPDEQPAPAPAQVKKVASARPSASAAAASSAPIPGASGSPPSTVLSLARPSASTLPVAGPASSVAASIIEVGSAAASSSAAPRQLYAAAPRDAINAAFEGRNAEAARLYERLSSAKGGRVFALAAHLVRENIVLKPAISH